MINLCKRNKRSRRVGWMEEEKENTKTKTHIHSAHRETYNQRRHPWSSKKIQCERK